MPGSILAGQRARENRRATETEVEVVVEVEVDLDSLSYRDLQKLAKSRGISASGKKVDLYSRLTEV